MVTRDSENYNNSLQSAEANSAHQECKNPPNLTGTKQGTKLKGYA